MSKYKILNNSSPRILGNQEKGLVFVISAPAGTGKTTLARMLCKEFDGMIHESVSCTTRAKRLNEQDGVDYYFLSPQEFEKNVRDGAFLEHSLVFDQYYGTLKSEIEKKTANGKHVILVIDTQGAMKIQKQIEAIFIFIAPPSLDELERRLRLRQTETEESIRKRLSWAEKEVLMADQYDYFIVNEDLQLAYQVLKSIVIAEEHKNRRS